MPTLSRTLTIDEFDTLTRFIYRKTGIRFEPQKQYFISKRLEKRMVALGMESVNEYIRMLRFGDHTGAEFQNLVDLLTVNETYFFRDFPQLQAFAEHCLMETVERKQAMNDRSMRIWSAACSTGEEPYTLSIILDAMLDNIEDWNIKILASDIDRVVISKAVRGVYFQRSIRDVPPEYLSRYFKHSDQSWAVIPKIKERVTFENLNLSDREAMQKNTGFDFIFCRNLLIYFDDVSRKKLVDQFYLALKKGGYIFLGSSESMGRMSSAFRMKRMGDYLVYQK